MEKRCMGCMKTYSQEYDVCPHCGYIDGSPAKEAYHMEPGRVLLGKYIVGRVVGYGGFGVTYIGWDFVLEQVVAIKEYLPSEFATRVPGEETITVYSGEKENQFAIGKDKFAEEAKKLAQFNAVEGVVEIKDTFLDNDTAYIVMEFLEGETLKERITREGKLSPEETLPIIKSVLKTLQEVHKGDIIHRDIAPDNIFLCSDGQVKLLDFGASRYATVQHSKSLSVILKEGYAPEEQYRSKGIQGPWSDVYAVGATMYKMLTGVTPEDAMERAENDKVKPIGKMGVKLSKSEETALMNAMNVFAEDRTQSADQFLKELEADEVKRKARTRKKIDLGKWPLWSKILVGCIALALVCTGFFLSQKSTFALEDGKAYVPEVINMKDSKATKKAEKNNLTLKIIGQEKSNKVDEKRVMTQYPDSGRIVNAGELVEVQISAGNSIVMVDVSGESKEEAQAILETLGFTNITFKDAEAAIPAGMIAKQSVKSGEEVSLNKKIVLTVSTGLAGIDPSKDVSVPGLTGMSFNSAVSKAAKSKLYVEKGAVKASDKPAGTILSQSVKKGNSVKQGTTITVTVSSGERKVEVPYVAYMEESKAKQTLSAYNLKYSVSYEHSETVASGLVISQNPGSGKNVKPGSKIKLVVSKGRTKVSVPNVVGMNYHSAADTLVNHDLRYTVTYSHSESVGWGKVISASPGGKQEKGTKITLNVSCGTAGKMVSASSYESSYSDSSKYSASPRYRYSTRQKEYVTSGSSSKGGWNRSGEKEIISQSKSTWSTSNKNGGMSPTDYGAYGIEKSVAEKRCYTHMTYHCKCKAYTYIVKGQKDTGTSHASYCDRIANIPLYIKSEERAGQNLLKYYNDIQKGHRYTFFGEVYDIQDNGKTVSAYHGNADYIFIRVMDRNGEINYQITTTKYRYNYWRWGSWSGWSDWTTKRTTGANVKESSERAYYVVGKSPN